MQVKESNDTTLLSIRKFLGLNENPDGDTTIKVGELAELRNFRITQDNHLQIRPGTKAVLSLADALVDAGAEIGEGTGETRLHGIWHGMAGGREHTLAAYAGRIFAINAKEASARIVGTLTEEETHFFGFDEKVYVLNGHEYMVWDGGDETEFEEVAGYVPLVQVATNPAGDGELLEPVNRLTGNRRVRFSPDGAATVFQLPQKEVDAVLSVTINGEAAAADTYTIDIAAGTVTFTAAPAAGTDTVEIAYRKGSGAREEVCAMHFSELYNGSTDTRVFLYGDGSNRAIYSGIRYDTGEPSAEYFPDLYEIAVGDANTPVTALVRHYNRLMAYKTDSAWVIQYGTATLSDGTATAAFYCQGVNRQLGNAAPGQAKLLENSPLTLDGRSVYQWKPSGYSTYISSNENNAKRISDRVMRTLGRFEFAKVKTFNLKSEHEFWIMQGNFALILNYANDTWYVYDGLTFERVVEVDGEKYGFGGDGRMVHISRAYRNDDGAEIDCCAVTGAMDFGRDWQVKYSPMLFVAMQPEDNARVSVTVETNRRSDYPEKAVAYSLATFEHVDFAHFSFATNRKPQVKRVKIKVKKATFYRLIFKSRSTSATATIIQTDIKLRYGSEVK